MNLQTTLKCGLPPNEAEKKLVDSEEYKLDYDFCRLKKIDETSGKYLRNDQKGIKTIKKNFVCRLKKEK